VAFKGSQKYEKFDVFDANRVEWLMDSVDGVAGGGLQAEKVYQLILNYRNGVKNSYPEIESIRR
jgi:hypothetical protein